MSALVALAEALARYVHRGQVDKQGAPYVEHLRRVAEAVEAAGGDENAVAGAWLHDAVEDNRVRWPFIEALFPVEVIVLLSLLARVEAETYAEYIGRVVEHSGARLVKLCDLRDNADPSRGPIRWSLRQRYERSIERLTAT